MKRRNEAEAGPSKPAKSQKMEPSKPAGLVSYPDSGSEESSSENEEESEEEEEEPPPNEFLNETVAKISQNIKAQPDYETLYNNKLLRSHLTNIQKVSKKFLFYFHCFELAAKFCVMFHKIISVQGAV